MDDWVTIRNLKKRNSGMGTREIAKLVGVSRNTVKRALSMESFCGYQRKGKTNEEIEPYADFIRESYLIRRQKVSVIIENMQSKGFTGSGISVYRHIDHHLKREREGANTRTFMPYETGPGEHMLYDWAEYTILLGEELRKVYVHMTELGYSRYKVLGASLSVTQSSVFEALEDACHALGGVCGRLQVDNAKVFVDDASVANLQWNRRFLGFCGFYGIRPTRSLPRHPWSKGKVENPFKYVEDHFITNMTFASFDDFHCKLKVFEEKVNERVHGTTHKRACDLFAQERDHLLALPGGEDPCRYIGLREEVRKATSDCLISYGGNRYSVPYLYARTEVWIRVSRGVYLRVYSKVGKLIATHVITSGKGKVILNKEHYTGYRNTSDRQSFSLVAQALTDRFGEYGRCEEFLVSLKAQKRINGGYNLSRISRLFDDYSDDDCIKCMEECLKYNCFSFAFVKGYLGAHGSIDVPAGNISILKEIGARYGISVKRNLQEYRI